MTTAATQSRPRDPAAILDLAMRIARPLLPSVDIDEAFFDDYMGRHRSWFIDQIRLGLEARAARAAPQRSTVVPPSAPAPPEEWTAARRTDANLAAMRLAATTAPEAMTPENRAVLAGYSGWGGLSIEKVRDKFPPEFPAPERRGLIHEYYTPSRVAREIARVVQPLLPTLPTIDGRVLALEPSAGIGRFIQAFTGLGFDASLNWYAVEWSTLSARMLRALRPDIDLTNAPFERWVRERVAEVRGRLGLVVSNPPYGARGAAVTEDPDRDYRERRAYAYFLRRTLDLLAPNGLGVYLIPAGFLTGTTPEHQRLRRTVLLRHHLLAGFRLPSRLFPGALLVTDVLFLRARGGSLIDVAPADVSIVEGHYFKTHPDHILGREVGTDAGEEDQTKRPRWGYQVEGQFTHLPDLPTPPRPMEGEVVADVSAPAPGDARDASPAAEDDETSSELVAQTSKLGLRVDRYLAALSRTDSQDAAKAYGELLQDLNAWVGKHGSPYRVLAVTHAAARGERGVQYFLRAFKRDGTLLEAFAVAPAYRPRYEGSRTDLVALAGFIYRETLAPVHLASIAALYYQLLQIGESGRSPDFLERVRQTLVAGGWCVDGDAYSWLPPDVYYSGNLWERYDRATAAAGAGDVQAATQARKLLEIIHPAVIADIEFSARDGWIPMTLINGWVNDQLQTDSSGYRLSSVTLAVQNGVLMVPEADYADVGKTVSAKTLTFLGYWNHDKTFFQPDAVLPDDWEAAASSTVLERKRQADAEAFEVEKHEVKDEGRLMAGRVLSESLRVWVNAEPTRREAFELAYNRKFRGFVNPTYSGEPLHMTRWAPSGPRLKPHQVAAVRRVEENRRGLVAFDVGVGKTFTGLAIIARARQEGWARRPVVCVPNSIVWKWWRDVNNVLPDYRVAVIGSERMRRRGQKPEDAGGSRADTPAERGRKWGDFQAGLYDLVILAYTALGRTRLNEDVLREYAAQVEAIAREVRITTRNRKGRRFKKKGKDGDESNEPSERAAAVEAEEVAKWVAERTELPKGWQYDEGFEWDKLGVDLLLVDEAQNFKNLYLPQPREHGVPRYMGSPGEGSKRAWALDFRAAAVRRQTGGPGVVLLSATPAKNSPLEFYSLLQLVDPSLWTKAGITNPEQFIDRFSRLESLPNLNTATGALQIGSACTGFINLHELRDLLFRYGEFKTALDVGLVLPTPETNVIELPLSTVQEDIYEGLSAEARKSKGGTGLLGIITKMSLAAVHPALLRDDPKDPASKITYKKAVADKTVDPHAPKFDACAQRIIATMRQGIACPIPPPKDPTIAAADQVRASSSCGHIVFVEPVAAHAWLRKVLVEVGVPDDRIAVLNAETAPGGEERTQIALAFNGDPDEGQAPKYDVIICNQVAYEGVDLQKRTCELHHIDLPWEPATLQQRNGRGWRQGNCFPTIALNYYFAQRSSDGPRFTLINGKAGWMGALLSSGNRETNNPAVSLDLDPNALLALAARDPELVRMQLAAAEAERRSAAVKRERIASARAFRAAVEHYQRASAASIDPTDAARHRADADRTLRELELKPAEVWPWTPVHAAARTGVAFAVPSEGGLPTYPRLRARVVPSAATEASRYIEFGQPTDDGTSGRWAGTVTWEPLAAKRMDEQFRSAAALDVSGWPADDETREAEAMKEAAQRLRWESWAVLGWHLAPDGWRTRVWAQHVALLLGELAHVDDYQARRAQRIPLRETNGHIAIVQGRDVSGRPHPMLVSTPLAVFAPTDTGFDAFVDTARRAELRGDLTWTSLDEATRYWWGRRMPKGLTKAAEGGAATPAENLVEIKVRLGDERRQIPVEGFGVSTAGGGPLLGVHRRVLLDKRSAVSFDDEDNSFIVTHAATGLAVRTKMTAAFARGLASYLVATVNADLQPSVDLENDLVAQGRVGEAVQQYLRQRAA